jgi:hypothetical protein
MSTQATSTFVIDSWDESGQDNQDGVRLGKVHLSKTFRGDLEGHSTVDLLQVQGHEQASRAYVALERITGRLHGRNGSFVLLHMATSTSAGPTATWLIVPDTGTDELRGIGGEAQITIGPDGGHTLTLAYDLVT